MPKSAYNSAKENCLSTDENTNVFTTVIGRGHSGTRAISHTLSQSGVYMGNLLNISGDLLPPDDIYEACCVFAKYVTYLGSMEWDFSKVHQMDIDLRFTKLIESYLSSVLTSSASQKGWKIPETTLIFPWILRLFPDIHYINWVRDPRDSILGAHLTDNLKDFGISSDETENILLRRATSIKYQFDIVEASPKPKKWITVRFEDFVRNQDVVLQRLENFLGFPLAKIQVDQASVGRYKTDQSPHDFPFLSKHYLYEEF